ncbi:MAG: hypothetical protein IT336_01740 [Thermomicrobiales bacterium]|nr:hypothetical protein [Thermomicrobiales bacterium]
MTDATPVSAVPAGLSALAMQPGLTPVQIAERLLAMPDDVDGLERRNVTTTVDSATAVYLAGEDQAQPRYGMAIVLVVEPDADADGKVAAIKQARWGDPADHHVTTAEPGAGTRPAYTAFWRVFPPGLFAIPNQPVYFAIWYRANDGYAYMVIGGEPIIRESLTAALATTLSSP